MNYEKKYLKYRNKYLALKKELEFNNQLGGIHYYNWTYNGKNNKREFSIENQILIERALRLGMIAVVIEHKVNEGSNIGQTKIYAINLIDNSPITELLIDPDQSVILAPTKLTYSNKFNVFIPPVPELDIMREYYTAEFGIFNVININGISEDSQKLINDMIINKKEYVYIFMNITHSDGKVKLTQLKITPNNVIYYDMKAMGSTLQFGVLKKITLKLLSKPVYYLPLTEETKIGNIDLNSIIFINKVRLTRAEIQEILDIGITSIKAEKAEFDRLFCDTCMVYEKNNTYLECGHLSMCDSCAIRWTKSKNVRDARGILKCSCPQCRTISNRFVNTRYGGNLV